MFADHIVINIDGDLEVEVAETQPRGLVQKMTLSNTSQKGEQNLAWTGLTVGQWGTSAFRQLVLVSLMTLGRVSSDNNK